MRAVDEAALFCDFAEFYHIYDWNQFPLRQQAALACGLSDKSRIVRKLTQQKLPLDSLLLVGIVDGLRDLSYRYTSAHSKKKPPQPQSLMEAFQPKKKSDVAAYDSPEAFERARVRIIGENNHG